MKIIDLILNAIRFKPKEVAIGLFLFGVIILSNYVSNLILSYEDKNKEQTRILNQKQEQNEQYNHVEDILEEHHDLTEKFKSIEAPDLFGFQEEIESLIPRGIQIEETKLDEEEFIIRGLSPNLRTIDFLVSILNMYNNYYGGFKGEVLLESTNKKDTLHSFRIKGTIDGEKLVNKIYSNDIDGDGVIDSVIEEVHNSSGVKQTKSIINDMCPYTPSFNIVIGKLIETNPTLAQSFPYYQENYEKGYFEFDSETGCLKNGDTEIVLENEVK